MKMQERPRQFELWINGKLTKPDSGAHITRISPAYNSPVTLVPEAAASDVNKATAATKQSFDAGTSANLPGAERAEILQAIMYEIAVGGK